MVRRRWGDNDTYFGPLTFARDRHYRPLAVVLASGCDEYPGASLRISGFGHTFILALPDWALLPYREKVVAKSWDEATIKRLGRNWYWNVHRREYGFSLSDGFLNVSLGRQTMDSSTDQRWGCFLPWTQWRHVRHSLYGLHGFLFCDVPQSNLESWEARQRVIDACPTVIFAFKDFDGEALTATTRIEEREWLFGTGWFKWLSWFRKPKISRSLDITFSGETGKRKGSWKGGTIGHSIDMRPGELHASAFARYCGEHDMQFLGAAR
jgi:hypothetical protein